MFNRVYLIAGGALIAGYMAFSYMGVELWAGRTESVPTAVSRSSSGRAGGGYYGGGWGYGK